MLAALQAIPMPPGVSFTGHLPPPEVMGPDQFAAAVKGASAPVPLIPPSLPVALHVTPPPVMPPSQQPPSAADPLEQLQDLLETTTPSVVSVSTYDPITEDPTAQKTTSEQTTTTVEPSSEASLIDSASVEQSSSTSGEFPPRSRCRERTPRAPLHVWHAQHLPLFSPRELCT